MLYWIRYFTSTCILYFQTERVFDTLRQQVVKSSLRHTNLFAVYTELLRSSKVGTSFPFICFAENNIPITLSMAQCYDWRFYYFLAFRDAREDIFFVFTASDCCNIFWSSLPQYRDWFTTYCIVQCCYSSIYSYVYKSLCY